MKTQFLGNSELNVSMICLGSMTWGEQNTAADAHAQLDYALAHGVNFIDTAEVYPIPVSAEKHGITEQYIGNWLGKSQRRSEVILASKIAGPRGDFIREGRGFLVEDLAVAIEGSLQRLQTDVIDLYQLHWPQRLVQLWGKQNFSESMYDNEAIEQLERFYAALADLKQTGKVRYFGLSNETPWGVMTYQRLAKQQGFPAMVSIQNAYSLLRREYEVGLAEISLYENIGLLAYSPLAGGILSGKYQTDMPENARFTLFPQLMGYYSNDRSRQALQQYQQLADELQLSLTTLSLAFVNQQAFVHSNIIGATTLQQLQENIASNTITLSEESLKRINEIFSDYPNPGNY